MGLVETLGLGQGEARSMWAGVREGARPGARLFVGEVLCWEGGAAARPDWGWRLWELDESRSPQNAPAQE